MNRSKAVVGEANLANFVTVSEPDISSNTVNLCPRTATVKLMATTTVASKNKPSVKFK